MTKKIFLIDIECGENYYEFATDSNCVEDVLQSFLKKDFGIRLKYLRIRQIDCIDLDSPFGVDLQKIWNDLEETERY